jgi:hypothetical protein
VADNARGDGVMVISQWKAARWRLVRSSRWGSHSRPEQAYAVRRIGMMQAINRNRLRVFDPARKDPQWGKRKLKREL